MQSFLGEVHENTFYDLLEKANVKNDIERESLFFIIAGNNELYKNVNKIYNFKENNINININEDGEIYIPDLPVSSSARKLAYLAIQLYNSCNKQSVMDTFAGLDENNFRLAINAIKLRFRMIEFQQHKGKITTINDEIKFQSVKEADELLFKLQGRHNL